MASGALKKATGLTGLRVAKDPHKTLRILYDKILRTLQLMPADAAYRVHTTSVVSDRLHQVKTTTTVSDLEKKIDCGIIEEVILQAERELQLSRKMMEWRAWEPLVDEAPKDQWQWPMKS